MACGLLSEPNLCGKEGKNSIYEVKKRRAGSAHRFGVMQLFLLPVVPDVLHIVILRAKPSVGKLKTCCKSSSFQFFISPKGLEISLCISQSI